MWPIGTKIVSLRRMSKRSMRGTPPLVMPAGTVAVVGEGRVPPFIQHIAAKRGTEAFWVIPEGYPPGTAFTRDWKPVEDDQSLNAESKFQSQPTGKWSTLERITGWNPLKERISG